MIKLTTKQKLWINDRLDVEGGFDTESDPVEKEQYERMLSCDWYIVEPGENGEETADKWYPHSLQYFYTDPAQHDGGYFKEIDCISDNILNEIQHI